MVGGQASVHVGIPVIAAAGRIADEGIDRIAFTDGLGEGIGELQLPASLKAALKTRLKARLMMCLFLPFLEALKLTFVKC